MPVSILLADDFPAVRRLITEALKLQGYVVETAKDGAEALDKFVAGKFSLLILDLQMPKKSGIEVARDLRDRGEKVPIIFISSYTPNMLKEAYGEQMNRVTILQKPLGASDLLSAVAEALAPNGMP